MDVQKLYSIEEGKVFLEKTAGSPRREIAVVTEDTQETVLQKLVENFEEVQKEWNEFKEVFQNEKELTKLAGKLSRKKSFFAEAKAIGAFDPIFQEIEECEKKIQFRILDVINQKGAFIHQITKLTETMPTSHNEWQDATSQMSGFKKAFYALPQVPHPDDEPAKEKLEAAIKDFLDVKEKNYESYKIELAANLDRKIELCERAEGIKDSDDWRKTSETFSQLLELWKAVGPVPRHKSDELWMRFNTAKDFFYTNKQKFYTELIGNLEENLKAKEEIVVQTEALKDSTEWNKTSDKMNELMEAWKKIGGVGKEHSDEIWNRFNAARDHFFSNKKNHFAGQKVDQENNLAKKISIASRANEIKDSADFEQTTQEFNELMEEWKKVGYASKKLSDEQWNIFFEAKKHFFARKDAWRDEQRGDLLGDINNRIGKNIAFLNKLQKELTLEEEILQDFQAKIDNIAASARSFESEERFTKTMEEAKEKAEKLRAKMSEVQAKIDGDKKERGRLSFWQKKKGENESSASNDGQANEGEERKPRSTDRGPKNFTQKKQPEKPTQTLLGAALKGLNLNLED